jgi:hypothetical protein
MRIYTNWLIPLLMYVDDSRIPFHLGNPSSPLSLNTLITSRRLGAYQFRSALVTQGHEENKAQVGCVQFHNIYTNPVQVFVKTFIGR